MKVSALNSKSIDLLNIALIFISLFVAFKLPFELFLFSYAILGPLHYLTEINWLKGKNYFVKDRKWVWVMVFFAIVMTVPIIVNIPNQRVLPTTGLFGYFIQYGAEIFFACLFITALFSVSLVYVKNQVQILLLFAASIILTMLIIKFKLFPFAFFTVFLPTIIHVYFFTLLFMIYGTIKTKSIPGMLSCIAVLLCPLIIWTGTVNPEDYMVGEKIQTAFLKSDFQNVSASIAKVLGALNDDGKFHLNSENGIKIQIFIAFCYTYHYLNWFSKTSIIGWNKNISKTKLALLLVIWLCSMALYFYDYKIGFAALFTVSLIHVFFEFPLNVISVQGIVGGIFTRRSPA